MSNRSNRRWIVAIVLSLALVASFTSASRAVIVAQWKFDSNGSFTTDSSGHSHTLTAAPETVNVTGGASGTNFDGSATFENSSLYSNPSSSNTTTGAADFNGQQSMITVDTLGLNAYKQITVEWFMKGTAQGNAGGVEPIFSGNPADTNGPSNPGDFSFDATGIFRDFNTANLSTSVNTAWHEYALVLDTSIANGGTGAGMKLYKDYVLVASTLTNAAAFKDTTFVLGKDYYGPSGIYGRTLIGQLDEVSISSGLLTPESFVSAPEPTAACLVAIGGAAMTLRRRRATH